MWRSAVVRWGAFAGIATLACWRGSAPPRDTPIENRSALVVEDRTGPYWCSIRDGEYAYPQMPCAIRRVGDQLVLAKLGGSQRFRGIVTPKGRGFTFDGELFCPWGDCNKPLRGEFRPAGAPGELRGAFEGDSMVVTLVRAPADSAWGGASYGGDGYGGFAYGGWGYGATKPPRRRRH